MYIKATGSLLLRAVSSNGGPCLSHVVISSSLNSSFDATNETLRASFLSEDVPSDLFDDASSSHCESTDDRPGSCGSTVERSDFSCAGPNRFWPYDEQGHTKLFDRIDSGEIVNMCLLHNVCWENSKLVLYLPPPFADLEAMGLFQFPSLGIGNPWIGSDHRRFLWYVSMFYSVAAHLLHRAFSHIMRRSSLSTQVPPNQIRVLPPQRPLCVEHHALPYAQEPTASRSAQHGPHPPRRPVVCLPRLGVLRFVGYWRPHCAVSKCVHYGSHPRIDSCIAIIPFFSFPSHYLIHRRLSFWYLL
jgi:hypothetical protein